VIDQLMGAVASLIGTVYPVRSGKPRMRRGKQKPTALPIRFSAVAHSKDTDGFVILIEPHAIVADAKAVLGRVDALEFFHIATSRLCKALDR